MFRKFLDDPLPFYCSIETEVNSDAGGQDGGAPPSGGDGEAPPSRQSVRDSLQKGFEDARRAPQQDNQGDRNDKGQFTKGKAPKRIAGGAEVEAEAPVEVPEGQEPEGGAKQEVGPVPDAFSKEAKAEWANVPATVQTAIIKREQDMAKGVEELKGKYRDIDAVLQPHLGAIRQHGHTPAQAVEQLFNWMRALSANPQIAFPALAKSFNFDLNKILGPQPAAAAQPAPGDVKLDPMADIPAPVKDYIGRLEKNLSDLASRISNKVGSLETNWLRDSEQKTNQLLMTWAKDKPHFEAVRQHMAHLIGSGAVGMKEDGSVDLDKAYDMAVYAIPEVRNQVIEAQRAAERKTAEDKVKAEQKAQSDAAAKSRQAAVSVGSGAPGAPGGSSSSQKKGGRKSVRESLNEAIEQVRS